MMKTAWSGITLHTTQRVKPVGLGKYENNICKGKFVMSPEYHLTEDILEFKLDTIDDGDSRYTEFSTYTYFFNVNSNNTDAKPFDTKSISEEEFND